MDHHALEYFQPYSDDRLTGHFHRVIALHDNPEINWENLSLEVPNLCRSWFELAHLSSKERIDLLHDFWLFKIPYHPKLDGALDRFFGSLDDIGIFITQLKFDDPYQIQLVYSVAKNGGFYRGLLPASEESIIALEKAFPNVIFPTDYLLFLQIHNGFGKLTDTGILSSEDVAKAYNEFQDRLKRLDSPTTSNQKGVNPKTLIPFYQSFGMPFFQCFWGEWYPENEMGTVYYSSTTNTISDCTKANPDIESMAFDTFTDWLLFYLEQFD